MLLLLLLLQDSPESALYGKCDSEIPWISDGTVLHDAEQLGNRPGNWRVDRRMLLARAREKAAQQKRLVLWYCPRTYGGHMNRAQVLDQYMKVVVFTDPAVVELVRDRFVPLRMCCDPDVAGDLKLRRFEFVEPGFLILSADGKVLHRIDRLRTFNAAWVRDVLAAVLKKFDPAHAPKDAPKDPPGLELLRSDKLDEAREAFVKDGSAESLYHLSYLDSITGLDPAPRWRELVEKHAGTRWAWRAAANLVRGADTLPDGPMAHRFEDLSHPPVTGLPTSTRLPAKDADSAARRAVRFLLRAQAPDGSWNDSRYVYCPDPAILPNVFVAVTALAALALVEWGEGGPALDRADAFLREEKNLARGKNEECYAEAYRLLYFARKKDVRAMNASVAKLAGIQDRSGLWAHEYPNPFATAAVVHSLAVARKAGADVPDATLSRAAKGIAAVRAKDGPRFAYSRGPASSEKNSMARSAMCELALLECGAGTRESVAAAVESYWKHLDRLEAVRVADFHADEELGGFFFFHGVFHTCEAAAAIGDAKSKRRFVEQLLSIAEIDGSFIDSHELGKGYGTAMALLVLRRTR